MHLGMPNPPGGRNCGVARTSQNGVGPQFVMTDIFLSYVSADRERVRPVRDAFAARGFEVFWDQQVPSGADWDSWIRQQLPKSKCAVVFFSASSVASDNVRHEATIAKRQGKLISVLLEELTAEQFPMGLYAQQAANLADWNSDFDHIEWRKLYREVETKLTPTWVQLQIHELEAELSAERARREITERRDKASQSQIAREVEAQQALRHERDEANDRLALLNLAVEKLRDERRGFESELQRFRASEVQQPAKGLPTKIVRRRHRLAPPTLRCIRVPSSLS